MFDRQNGHIASPPVRAATVAGSRLYMGDGGGGRISTSSEGKLTAFLKEKLSYHRIFGQADCPVVSL
jgi:hypothetical protein